MATGNTPKPKRIVVDGKELTSVCSVALEFRVDSVATVKLELYAKDVVIDPDGTIYIDTD